MSIDSGQRPIALTGLMATLDTALPREVAGEIDRRGVVVFRFAAYPRGGARSLATTRRTVQSVAGERARSGPEPG